MEKRATAKELFKDKMEMCPITKDGCGFKKGDHCHGDNEPFEVRSRMYTSTGKLRSRCPIVNRRAKAKQPEQADWVGHDIP